MIKFLFKAIIATSVLAGIGYYSNYLLTGKTPNIDINKLTTSDINISKFTDTLSNKFEIIKQDVSTKDTFLYKWKDAKGVMHYTSEKPTGNIQNLESIKLNNDTNVVPAIPVLGTKETPSSIQQQPQVATDSPSNVYSPEGIKKLFNQAKDVQDLMNEQFSQQENLINQD